MAAGIRQRRNDSALRLLASRGADSAYRFADTHPDSGCGIKILPRSLFLELPFFNHMHRFMPSLVRRHGGIVLGIPVAHRPRVAGTSKYRILDRLFVGISDVLGVIWLLRRAPAQGDVVSMSDRRPRGERTYRKRSCRERSGLMVSFLSDKIGFAATQLTQALLWLFPFLPKSLAENPSKSWWLSVLLAKAFCDAVYSAMVDL